MAHTVAGASSCSSHVTPKKYDVFISFRGEDTRDNFTSHLHDALLRNQIETYIDYRLEKGDEVWPALVQAIQDSTVFLVILSENYASSTWCLNELIEIMECKKNGQHVIPVFYRIDPSHVRKQTGSYQTAFAKHEKDFEVTKKALLSQAANIVGSGFSSGDLKHSQDKVQKWKDVLHEVANIGGFDSCKYSTEADLVKDIIIDVLKKLDHKYPNELRGHYIVDQNYKRIGCLMGSKPEKVQFIGIWGMGGIGKTAVATAIFDKVFFKYEGSCFLKNVREESEKFGLDCLHRKLLSELLGVNMSPSFNVNRLKHRLKHKKVLIVLDDVNRSKDLKYLVGGHDQLGAGSRVIVTTRDQHVLNSIEVDEFYEVKPMNFQDSLRLFNLNAFNKTHPKKGYEELSKRAVVHANGIPLALEVLGSFLRSKSENEWDSTLAKLKKIPNAEILKVLRLSYDELDRNDKDIFLDIACFFKGWRRDEVTRILDACDFFAPIGIRNLLDKALITIDSGNCIKMHDLIQEMGWEIVRGESIKDPGRRSRIWNSEEVCDIFKYNRGTDTVEGIFLDLTNVPRGLNLSSRVFRKMPKLRLLCLYYPKMETELRHCNHVYLTKGLASLPTGLRYIRLDGFSLKSSPSTFGFEKLVELSLRNMSTEKLWDGVQNLPGLEIIDLSHSERLMELPDLSGARNLKEVNLFRCESLPHLHPSISYLPKLEMLRLDGCTAFTSLWGSGGQASLPPASDCSSFQELLFTSNRITNLLFAFTAMKELPSSIIHLRNLHSFQFPICNNLIELPENFASTILLSDPVGNDCDAFISLRAALQSPGFRFVKFLCLYSCYRLSELPDNISLLSTLQILCISRSQIITLPKSIKYLPLLVTVYLESCESLLSIPELPPSVQKLSVWNCKSLKAVSSLLRETPKGLETSQISSAYYTEIWRYMKSDREFVFWNCINLDPDSAETILNETLEAIAKSLQEQRYSWYPSKGIISIFMCLPAISIGDQCRLDKSSTEAWISVEIDPNSDIFGLLFFVTLSPDATFGQDGPVLVCQCYLETRGDQWLYTTSHYRCFSECPRQDEYRLDTDHVFSWYDAKCSATIMKAIKESEAINDGGTVDIPRLKCVFSSPVLNPDAEDKDMMIKECGLFLL